MGRETTGSPGALDRLEASGLAAPPRDNGELVFTAPWESRVFGLAIALHERRVFEWDEFRERLIAEIADWERVHVRASQDAPYRYYERWQAALEAVLADKSICASREIDARQRSLAARPDGHDH